jgi:tRNA threonylcarbamoyladenosine biosynthesis protein TsaE
MKMELEVRGPEAMRRLGRAMGEALRHVADASAVIGIEGELGAGKTTLVAGVLAAWGVTGAVRSPTYTLIEPYELSDRTIYHLDLYRIADPDELEALGLRDMASGANVLLIEWPSRAVGRLPSIDLDLVIHYAGPDARKVRARANTGTGDKVVRSILSAASELGSVSP